MCHHVKVTKILICLSLKSCKSLWQAHDLERSLTLKQLALEFNSFQIRSPQPMDVYETKLLKSVSCEYTSLLIRR